MDKKRVKKFLTNIKLKGINKSIHIYMKRKEGEKLCRAE
jgi:hypothetical protein